MPRGVIFFSAKATGDSPCSASDFLQILPAEKSNGWDTGLPPKLLKNVAKGTATSLTSLYNNCIEQNTWPSAWKMGEWTPLFKKGDRQDPRNCRSITSLIAVDKIFELLLRN